MKLYTEEQVNQIIDRAYDLELGTDEQMTGYLMMNITPIELPSDEEIGQQFKNYSENWEIRQAQCKHCTVLANRASKNKKKEGIIIAF